MSAPILAGAEPWSAQGGPDGTLVLHGFTGNPQSMRGLAEALAGAGFAVELPLLPGHGTSIEDMLPSRWDDWSEVADGASSVILDQVEANTGAKFLRVPFQGGGAGINALAGENVDIAQGFYSEFRGLDAGTDVMPGIGSDIALEGVQELAYAGSPVAPMLSFMEATDEIAADLGRIRCPVLLLSSRQDHVVPSASGDVLEAGVAGPIERVWLERSYHVATLDNDRGLVEERTVEFATKVTAA